MYREGDEATRIDLGLAWSNFNCVLSVDRCQMGKREKVLRRGETLLFSFFIGSDL